MIDSSTALLLVDVQKGFLDPLYWGARNNPGLETSIKRILTAFRSRKRPIIHVQHLSKEPFSPLRPGQSGVDFMECATPIDEVIFQKSVNSAFIGTDLEKYLREKQIETLVIVGLTTDHCVSTTTRMASNLGFKVTLISDATACFDRLGIDEKLFSAELVHQVSLASLNKEFASVLTTETLLA